MMKFTMNAKELKAMMEKGISAINKKAAIPTLTKLYFQVEENGTVKVLGTDNDHFAEIRTGYDWNRSFYYSWADFFCKVQKWKFG